MRKFQTVAEAASQVANAIGRMEIGLSVAEMALINLSPDNLTPGDVSMIQAALVEIRAALKIAKGA